jgi:hypothetical protein
MFKILYTFSILTVLLVFYQYKLHKITLNENKEFVNRLSSMVFGFLIIWLFITKSREVYFYVFAAIYFLVLISYLYVFGKKYRDDIKRVSYTAFRSRRQKLELVIITVVAFFSTIIISASPGNSRYDFWIWIFVIFLLCSIFAKEIIVNWRK